MIEKITFTASFPEIQSAIKIDGSGGMRITLDIPESEMAEAIKLTLYRRVALTVIVSAKPADKKSKSKRDDIDNVLDELEEYDSN